MKLKKLFIIGLLVVGSGYIFSRLISENLKFDDFAFDFDEIDERDMFI